MFLTDQATRPGLQAGVRLTQTAATWTCRFTLCCLSFPVNHTVVITPAWFNPQNTPCTYSPASWSHFASSSSAPQALAGRIFWKGGPAALQDPETREPRVCGGDRGFASATYSLGLASQSISGGCGRPWGPFRSTRVSSIPGSFCRAWGSQALSHSESFPRGVFFQRLQSPTMSHSRAPHEA